MRKLKRRTSGRRIKKSTIPVTGKKRIAFADIVTIFDDEACKICGNRQIARLIALNTLQEYILKHTKNITIV